MASRELFLLPIFPLSPTTLASEVLFAPGGVCDGICVRDTVNTDFMEGVLPVSSTGFAPGSIYGSTFTLSNSQYGVCRAPLVQFCRAPTGTPLNFVRLRMFWNSCHKRSKDRLRTAAGACVDLVAMRRKGRCLSLC